jgi:hypothetical protein
VPQEQWGGEVKMPAWLRRMLHMRELPGDTPERAHEARKPPEGPSSLENANRAATGALVDIYHEGRKNKGH